MAGYYNYSMSNNAVNAYNNGLLPASKVAKLFGCKTEIIVKHCPYAEWHHTSCKYNITKFYDPLTCAAELIDTNFLTQKGKEKARLLIVAEKIEAYKQHKTIIFNNQVKTHNTFYNYKRFLIKKVSQFFGQDIAELFKTRFNARYYYELPKFLPKNLNDLKDIDKLKNWLIKAYNITF